MVINKTTIAVAVAVYFTAGCTIGPKYPDSEEMYIKASALTKLSAAMESMVRYKNPPPDLSESDLLTLATRHDPILLENFKAYKVRVLRQDRHSIVLVCDAAGTRLYWKMLAVPVPWIATDGWRSRSRASLR